MFESILKSMSRTRAAMILDTSECILADALDRVTLRRVIFNTDKGSRAIVYDAVRRILLCADVNTQLATDFTSRLLCANQMHAQTALTAVLARVRQALYVLKKLES